MTTTTLRPLTDRQAAVARFIWDYRDRNGYPPTYTEIAVAFNFHGRSAAKVHVDAIAKKGWLTMLPGQARTIKFANEITEVDLGL